MWQESKVKCPKGSYVPAYYTYTISFPHKHKPCCPQIHTPAPLDASRFVVEAKNFGKRPLWWPLVFLQDSLHHPLSFPPAASGFCSFLKQVTWPLWSSQLILIFNLCWPRVAELSASLAISSLIFRSSSSVPPSRSIGCEENYWNEF